MIPVTDYCFLAKYATSPLPQHLTTDYLDLQCTLNRIWWLQHYFQTWAHPSKEKREKKRFSTKFMESFSELHGFLTMFLSKRFGLLSILNLQNFQASCNNHKRNSEFSGQVLNCPILLSSDSRSCGAFPSSSCQHHIVVPQTAIMRNHWSMWQLGHAHVWGNSLSHQPECSSARKQGRSTATKSSWDHGKQSWVWFQKLN